MRTAQVLGAKGAKVPKATAADLARLLEALASGITALDKALAAAHKGADAAAHAIAIRDKVRPAMEHLRSVTDELEATVGDDYWPLPKYREMLFIY